MHSNKFRDTAFRWGWKRNQPTKKQPKPKPNQNRQETTNPQSPPPKRKKHPPGEKKKKKTTKAARITWRYSPPSQSRPASASARARRPSRPPGLPCAKPAPPPSPPARRPPPPHGRLAFPRAGVCFAPEKLSWNSTNRLVVVGYLFLSCALFAVFVLVVLVVLVVFVVLLVFAHLFLGLLFSDVCGLWVLKFRVV